MKRRWLFAWAWTIATVLLSSNCAFFFGPPDPAPDRPPVEAPKVATLAVVVSDAATRDRVTGALVTLHTGESALTNDQGYAAFHNLQLGERGLTIEAEGYPDSGHEAKPFTQNQEVPILLEKTPPPPPEPPQPPSTLKNLNLFVVDATTVRPVATARATVNGDTREADGGGFINFAVDGQVSVEVKATGYVAHASKLDPGDQRVQLMAIPPPKPKPGTIAKYSIDQVLAIVKTVHDTEGWNLGASSTRESRNRFWSRAIGIIHHGHKTFNPTPDPRWHIKDAGGGRPQSDDVVVLMPSREWWDCIPGAGADGYRFQAHKGEGGALPLEQNVYAPPKPQ